MAPSVTNIAPEPGSLLSASWQVARFTPIVFELSVDAGYVPVVRVKYGENPHAWPVVFDGAKFSPLFAPDSSIESDGDVHTFSILPRGGWWRGFSLQPGQAKAAIVPTPVIADPVQWSLVGSLVAEAESVEEIPPDTPTGLAADEQDKEIDLTWDAVSGATSYTIEGSDNDADWSTVASGLTETEYTETGLDYEQTRYYRVIAVGESGSSDPSASVSKTTIPVLPKSAAHLAKIGHPAAAVGLRFDVASGDVTDFIGGSASVSFVSVTHDVDSSDLPGQKAIGFAEGVGSRLTASDTALGDATGSVQFLFVGRMGANPGGTRSILRKRSSGPGWELRYLSTGRLNVRILDSGGDQSFTGSNHDHANTLTVAAGGARHSATAIEVASQLGQDGATLTRTGSHSNAVPLSAGHPADSSLATPAIPEYLYALVMLDANAEALTAAQLRDFWVSRLTDAGAYP